MRAFVTMMGVLYLVLGSQHIQAESYYSGSFPATTEQFTLVQLQVLGETRQAWVFKPSTVAQPPMMIFFSGTGGTADYSTLDELGKEQVQNFANREGVLLVFPLARQIPRGDWDHASDAIYWQTATEAALESPVASNVQQNPDLLFTQALMDEAYRAYHIDNNRVYLNGFSSGAFFAYFAAAVLHERVAAFAETGGGLVLSHTTSGQPPCVVPVSDGESGSHRSCLAAGWTAQRCVSANATPRPIAPQAVEWIPPAFMQANDDDNAVPFAHSCHLANALAAMTETEIQIIHQGGGHIINAQYLQDAWQFLRNKRLDAALYKAAERIFNYAEVTYPDLFSPASSSSALDFGYYFRHYPLRSSYLGLQGHTLYYYFPQTGIQAAGTIADWLPLARQAGF